MINIILTRPLVKEALVLVVSGAISALICGRVFAASPSDVEQAALTGTSMARAQAQYTTRLAPMSKDQGREMLLSAFHGQVPLANPTPAPNR